MALSPELEYNDEYIDFPFDDEDRLPVLVDEETGEEYKVGRGFNGYGNQERFASYDSAAPVLSRAEIEREAEITEAEGKGTANLIVEVKNQKSEGSCVGNAATQGLQVIQARRLGKKKVTLLSAIATYKQIGRSANSGAMVDDSMDALQDTGTVPLNTEANIAEFGEDACMPATGFSTRYCAKFKETAKKFRLGEVLVVRSFEALCSAVLSGHPVVVGREGHSILYLEIRKKNGRLYALYVNSWGKWGQGAGDFSYGFGLDTENQIRKSAGWAYAMRSMVER
jgi:hypothetical protein